MQIPILRGVIDRRILVNYHVDPAILAPLVPAPFRPRLVHGVGLFPKASIEFDCALLMRGIEHEWHGKADLCCAASGSAKQMAAP
jgi:hypothetical protein